MMLVVGWRPHYGQKRRPLLFATKCTIVAPSVRQYSGPYLSSTMLSAPIAAVLRLLHQPLPPRSHSLNSCSRLADRSAEVSSGA